jgi:TRAP-type C4-dicarboxylate transport system permease small subunit
MSTARRDVGGRDLGARLFLAIVISLVFAVPAALLLWAVLYVWVDVIFDLDQMEHKLLQYFAWCYGACYVSSFLAILFLLPESTIRRGNPKG